MEKYPEPDFRALHAYLDNTQLNLLIQFGEILMIRNKQWCIETAKPAQPRTDGKFKASLRCNKIDVNVAGIAKTCEGGGGHAKAAGVLLDSSPWELFTQMIITIGDERHKVNISLTMC